MIGFSYAAIVLALGSVTACAVLQRRGIWGRHKRKTVAVSGLAIILAIIGLIGVLA